MSYRNHPISDYLSIVDEHTQLVDVRLPEEVVEGTLPGAVNIPLSDLPYRIDELDRDRPVVLLCRSGGRSAQAGEFLHRSGFSKITNLEGGMLSFNGRTATS